MTRIDGIVPIIPVPFNKDESINFSDLKRLVKYCVSSGASAVCLPAYASEFYKLSENEREMVIGIAVEASANKIPVIGQANHVSSHIACEMAKRYQELGVDIISTAVPRLFPLNENLMQSEGDEEIIKSLVHQSLNHPQIREIQSNFIPVIRGSEWSKDTVISIEKGLKKAGHKIIFFQGTQSILN